MRGRTLFPKKYNIQQTGDAHYPKATTQVGMNRSEVHIKYAEFLVRKSQVAGYLKKVGPVSMKERCLNAQQY